MRRDGTHGDAEIARLQAYTGWLDRQREGMGRRETARWCPDWDSNPDTLSDEGF